jgi:hypothetical protein
MRGRSHALFVFVFVSKKALKTFDTPTRSDIGRELTNGWFNGVKVSPKSSRV